ncbi:hypothetical protein [Arthrobacter rhizosphaerae]|uniref:hypothetical protein n=1 Tax=Arthrobacter rhizosphaerae TaxID=2855490 RepID=UPI001FF2F478|nr:hypothetical protein [Arthrobacter rhizosphaerae]
MMSARLPSPTRGILVIGWVVLFLAAGGTAAAIWSDSGGGAGIAGTGATVPVTLSPGTPTANLFPGGSSDVLLTVSNPNTSPVRLGSLVLDTGQGTGGFAVDPAHPACGVASLDYTAQGNAGAGWTVPAKSGSVEGSLTIRLVNALSMGLDAADACQGARITVYLAVGS